MLLRRRPRPSRRLRLLRRTVVVRSLVLAGNGARFVFGFEPARIRKPPLLWAGIRACLLWYMYCL